MRRRKKKSPTRSFDDDETPFFLASLYSNDSLLVGVPGVSYDHLFNIDDFPEVSDCVRKDMDEYRNLVIPKLKKDHIVPRIWYLLKFPPRQGMTGVQLSVREIYRNDDITDDTSLDLSYFPVITEHVVCGKISTWWATWDVVCHDIGEKQGDRNRQRGAPDLGKKKSKAAVMASHYMKSSDKKKQPPKDDISMSDEYSHMKDEA